jgi:hypothetical protein
MFVGELGKRQAAKIEGDVSTRKASTISVWVGEILGIRAFDFTFFGM